MMPSFQQLIDLDILRPLLKTFASTSGLPVAIIDREGKVLVTSRWQKVCTLYHRRIPLSLRRCIESDTDFSAFTRDGKPAVTGDHFESVCGNGLVHIGFPILIAGELLATLFISQFFYDPPDLAHFQAQAREFGIEEGPYLEAVQEVPILDRRKVQEVLGFYSGLVKLLERVGSEQMRSLESRRRLEVSERKFRAIFDSALDSIVLVASDGRLLEVNPQTSVNLGYAREELLALRKRDIHTPEERPRIGKYLDKIMREGSDLLETVQRRKDGTSFPVEISGRRVDLLGKPAVLCLTRDITKRKQAEEELKRALGTAEEAREKIAAILKAVPDGLIVTDLSDRVVLMNEAAERLLHHPSSALAPLNEVLVEPGVREQIAASRLRGEEQGPYEWEAKAGPEGQILLLQTRSMPVRTAAGQLSGTITVLRDITREREVDRMKDDFISTAAHELRTPLTTVMGYVELLLRQNQHVFAPEEQRGFLETVYQRSEALEKIIDDLLNLSRIRSGHLISVNKSKQDLVALIEEMIDTYQEMSRRHRFVGAFPAAPVYLLFDPAKIRQVLENLLSNAVKFSPAGGEIRISGQRIDGYFQVTVADQGIGMRPEQAVRIFEKFYRADASATAASGLGLGMSITRNIVEAHGGEIWVESEPARGTRVHFTLPLGETGGSSRPPSSRPSAE